MKTNLPIDETFRLNLQDYAEKPPMHVFDHIMEIRAQRRSKRPFPIILVALLSLLIAATIGYFTWLRPADVPLDSFPVPIKLAKTQELPADPPILHVDPSKITPA
jgi:hypothetical protein